jgi:hypothetical protein
MNLFTKSLAVAALGLGLLAVPATAKADSFSIAYSTGTPYKTVHYVPDRGHYQRPVFKKVVYQPRHYRHFGHPVGYKKVVYRGHPGKGHKHGHWKHDRRYSWR